MTFAIHRDFARSITGALLCGLLSSKASALQPLDTFLKAARSASYDNRESAASTRQRSAEADVSKGRLYPVVSVTGAATRNQYEVSFAMPPDLGGTGENLIIQPQNQLDGALTVSVPVIDVAAWRRISAADASEDAARASQVSTQQDVELGVSRAYYLLVGQTAVLEAAKRSLLVLEQNLKLVKDKQESGVASELDVQRARAEIARQEGDVATAEFAVVNARRQLATASSIEPEPVTVFPEDDLHQEKPLPNWMAYASTNPRVTTARALQLAAEKGTEAAEAAWYPTIAASAQERVTNASSFSGHDVYYTLQATLNWRFDATLSPTERAQRAAEEGSKVRAERAERGVQDAIYEAWHRVRAAIEKSRAARVQIDASALASELARDRYTIGAATQLEVLEAQQDAFRAEVARVQADTELAVARAVLRAAAGYAGEGSRP
ncbi:MAG TPA: TolC family protein [Polyangiales bacterium]|nr:TolC family protein [Polyangiales bacterium]